MPPSTHVHSIFWYVNERLTLVAVLDVVGHARVRQLDRGDLVPVAEQADQDGREGLVVHERIEEERRARAPFRRDRDRLVLPLAGRQTRRRVARRDDLVRDRRDRDRRLAEHTLLCARRQHRRGNAVRIRRARARGTGRSCRAGLSVAAGDARCALRSRQPGRADGVPADRALVLPAVGGGRHEPDLAVAVDAGVDRLRGARPGRRKCVRRRGRSENGDERRSYRDPTFHSLPPG